MKQLNEELKTDEKAVELPMEVRRKITDEILQRLRSLNANANITEQRGWFIYIHRFYAIVVPLNY